MKPCDTCFWSAELTRGQEAVWCSHAKWHGWHTAAVCDATAYRKDTRP